MTRTTKGIGLMILTVMTFAMQDGFSRLLAGNYNTLMVVMVRYWIFAAFVLTLALRRPEGMRAAVRSGRLGAHIIRALLLVVEICVIVWGYTLIGLINSHAVFAICPLLIVALSGPLLGERISLSRWAAVGMGCVGVLVILQPGAEVFSWPALLPLASAVMFALYSVLTRLTTRDEPSFPAFFWPPVIGAVVMTFVGLPQWQAVTPRDWVFLLIYGLLSVLSNFLLQRTYETVEANVVQPFAYLQIVFVTMVGLTFFNEVLHVHVVVGVVIVVLAGLVTLLLQRRDQVAA
ncbi:MAG: DMT family transporter [Candidatus Saccharibacteria bacterium]|nr:DMT family transporter [Pseudorhodobacter sp.]